MHIVVDLPPDPIRYADMVREVLRRQIPLSRVYGGVLMFAGGISIGLLRGSADTLAVVALLVGALMSAVPTLYLRRMRRES
ncbi:MAG TPA: hypothetical protein VD813_12460, partial [Pseudonocardia sp.]|nr:hypothetical protein [Pseudonocardia sp.]